jgi:hypothetical protein
MVVLYHKLRLLDLVFDSLDYNNGYQIMSGTSMATPGHPGTLACFTKDIKIFMGLSLWLH